MYSFDFVSDSALRLALQSDERELQRCFEAGAWKAVHVLAGSIVEAVLVDYLTSVGSAPAALIPKMTLGQLVTESAKAGALSQRTVDLSSAVKEYRNLIHPGRAIRLAERVDEDASTVVRALVGIVAEEVAREKQKTYGLTAEQLLGKLERDRSVLPLLKHLASETKEVELLRLLRDLIPTRLLESIDDTQLDPELARHLSVCHRELVRILPRDGCCELAQRFVAVMRDGSSFTIQVYLDHLVRSNDLSYLKGRDLRIAVDRLLAELQEGLPEGRVPQCARGLAQFLEPSDVQSLVDPVVRVIIRGDRAGAFHAKRYLEGEHLVTHRDLDTEIADRLEKWEGAAARSPTTSALDSIRELTALFRGPIDDLPF